MKNEKEKTINDFYWRRSRRQDNCLIVLDLLCDACEWRLSRRQSNGEPCAAFQSGVYLLRRSHERCCGGVVVICGSIVAMQSINYRLFFHRLTTINKCRRQTQMRRMENRWNRSTLCARKQIAVALTGSRENTFFTGYSCVGLTWVSLS